MPSNSLSTAQGPEEMCLSLEHQNPSKTSDKMGYFDRVTVSLLIVYTANQETEGSQDRLAVLKYGKKGNNFTRHFVPRSPLRATCCAPARLWLADIDFQMAICEEIVYSRFIGLINRAKRQV